MERVKKVTEETLIPLSLVLVILGSVSYFTGVTASERDHDRRIEVLEKKQEHYDEVANLILQRITVVETQGTERRGRK